MEQRISFVTLGVRDVARQAAFLKGLGWRHSPKHGEAWYQCGGMILFLYPRSELAEDAGVSSEGDGFRGFTLAHNVRSKGEVDAALVQAKAAGAEIVKSAQNAFWGAIPAISATPTAISGRSLGTRISRWTTPAPWPSSRPRRKSLGQMNLWLSFCSTRRSAEATSTWIESAMSRETRRYEHVLDRLVAS